MKNLIYVLVFAVAFVSCKKDATKDIKKENVENAVNQDAVAKDFPVMTFDKVEHDFGNINEGDKVSTTFEYTNTGTSDLVIASMKGSCGCTVPNDWSKEALAPGGKGKFTVEFNSANKPNKQRKTVTITANTKNGREQVAIVAEVAPDPNKPAKAAPQVTPVPAK